MSLVQATIHQEPVATHANRPTHYAYQIRDREGAKGVWTRIGSVWPHSDGKGFNIQLTSLPIDGRITPRVPRKMGQTVPRPHSRGWTS